MSTLLHATAYVLTQFPECTGTDYKQNGITEITLLLLGSLSKSRDLCIVARSHAHGIG
jgi:hypothetical protein